MKENLNSTKYRNGDAIPNVTDNHAWFHLTTGAYCNYNNDTNNAVTYGRLYNWYAVNTGKLCPEGWHVPTYTEWSTLIKYLGDTLVAGGKMKEAGTIHWISPKAGATNTGGFSSLAGGWRPPLGGFNYIGHIGNFWTAKSPKI